MSGESSIRLAIRGVRVSSSFRIPATCTRKRLADSVILCELTVSAWATSSSVLRALAIACRRVGPSKTSFSSA